MNRFLDACLVFFMICVIVIVIAVYRAVTGPEWTLINLAGHDYYRNNMSSHIQPVHSPECRACKAKAQ